MRVVVLGCGPAGLVAAHVASVLAHDVTIISKDARQSVLFGCQYLHRPIPGYSQGISSVTVQYSLIGTSEGYRQKVYGDNWQGKVSPEDFAGVHQAWDIRETYRRMWHDYKSLVHEYKVVDGNLDFIRKMYKPDLIISTMPATRLCEYEEHYFRQHVIYANGTTEYKDSLHNEIICDGTLEHDWYRMADVFGYRTVEWPSNDLHPPYAARVIKPLSTDCDCHPEVIRAGRYGEWSKGVLVHQVYNKVLEALK